MSKTLLEFTGTRDNNFNLIRFIAASLVLFTHSFVLAGNSEPLVASLGMSWGNIAVDVFFITSGFLIAGSFFSRNNLLAFIWARVLRIYPALIVATLLCVVGLGWYFTTESTSSFFADPVTLKFIKRNVTLFNGVRYELPGVFELNPYPRAINGSLWTLPYEIKMYAYLALIAGVLLLAQKHLKKAILKPLFFIITLCGVLLNLVSHFFPHIADFELQFFALFFYGALFYVFKEKIILSSRIACLLAIVLFFSVLNQTVFFISYQIVLPYLLIYISYVPKGAFIRRFNQFGDYSYGIYIYAFPVQQAIAAFFPQVSVILMLVASFLITFIFAFLSWHLIEKRILHFKGRYIIAENFIRGLKQRFSVAYEKH